MSLITQQSRVSHHTLTNSGSTFTVPASEDFTDGSWLITDLALSEFGINEGNQKLFVRIDSNIYQVPLSSSLTGSSYDFCPTGIKTSAISGCSPVDIYDNLNLQIGKQITAANGGALLALDYGNTPNAVVLSDSNGFTTNNMIMYDGNYWRFRATNNAIDMAAQSSQVGIGTGFDGILLNPDISSNQFVTITQDSGGTNVMIVTQTGTTIGTQKSIKSENGGGRIDLDFAGNANTVLISTDNGLSSTASLFINTRYGKMKGDGIAYVQASGDTVYNQGVLVEINTGADEIKVASNSVSSVTSRNVNNQAVLIGSSNSVVNSGINNSVVIGGTGLTATTSNTVYVPNLNIRDGIVMNGTKYLTKTVNIGSWNMDTGSTVAIAHGLSDFTKIRNVASMIIDDTSVVIVPIGHFAGSGQVAGLWSADSTNINLFRVAGEFFDNSNYDSTSMNRGYITIDYEI